MAIDKTDAASRWFKKCWRAHLWLFYGLIIAVDLVGIFLINARSK